MVGCLGDMETVMIKLHEEPNLSFLIVTLEEEVGCGDTGWPEKTCQSQGHLGFNLTTIITLQQ